MIIYHGHPPPSTIHQAQQHAPSHTHGAEWSPAKMTPHDWPYIIDNGAFSAYVNNEPWDATSFVSRVSQVKNMPRDPDFIVLPDVVTNPELTIKRSSEWTGIINYNKAFAVQDGIKPMKAVEVADRLDCTTVFVGGTVKWKQNNAEEFVSACHDHGLLCHIGRPGDLVWANDIGADSVDTISIGRDQSWHRLERLENKVGTQATLTG